MTRWIAVVQERIPPRIRAQIWRLLTLASLLLVGVGSAYAWSELRASDLRVAPSYIALAGAIYVVTYGMQMLGWHTLATQFFGRLPLRDNAEAVAISSLVKYLPTIAWYIANRVHFYAQRQIPRKAVVAASLGELVAMASSGGVLYLVYWLARGNALALLAVAGSGLILLAIARLSGLLGRWRERMVVSLAARGVTPALHRRWLVAWLWYGCTWPLGVCFLWAVLRTFVPLQLHDLLALFNVWLLVGLASYAMSLSLGSIGIAREITLTLLLAQTWPLPAAVTTAIVVKLLLTLGEIGCSALVLGWLYWSRKRALRE